MDVSLDVNIVIDSIVQTQSSFTLAIGGKHFDQHLLKLMKNDGALVEEFEKLKNEGIELNDEFACFVKQQPDVCHVLVGHETKPNADAGTSLSAMDSVAAVATEESLEEDTEMPEKEEEETAKDVPETIQVEYKGHKVRKHCYYSQIHHRY